MSKFRKKIPMNKSKKMFTRHADMNHVHPKNAYMVGPMRGGNRM